MLQHVSVAPSRGLLSFCRFYPGAHAPGYEYAAPPALILNDNPFQDRTRCRIANS
jgi:hypothetical protein